MSRVGKPGPRSAAGPKLDDPKVEAMRREHAQQIDAINKAPGMQMRFVSDVSLADGIETPVAHGLGRPPVFVLPSAPRGAVATGRIDEVESPLTPVDTSKYVVLKASGWGATITVTVQVA